MAESTVREWTNTPESVRLPVLAAVLFVRDQKGMSRGLPGRLAKHVTIEITRQLAGYLDGMGDTKRWSILSAAPGVEEDAGRGLPAGQGGSAGFRRRSEGFRSG